jgi:hypothetical protein
MTQLKYIINNGLFYFLTSDGAFGETLLQSMKHPNHVISTKRRTDGGYGSNLHLARAEISLQTSESRKPFLDFSTPGVTLRFTRCGRNDVFKYIINNGLISVSLLQKKKITTHNRS